MITETTYSPYDLESGTCISCGEKSDEILIGDASIVLNVNCFIKWQWTW